MERFVPQEIFQLQGLNPGPSMCQVGYNFFIAEAIFIVRIVRVFFIQPSVDGHIGCFCCVAVVDSFSFLFHSLNFSSQPFFLSLNLVRLVSASGSFLHFCCLDCPSPRSYHGLLVILILSAQILLKWRCRRSCPWSWCQKQLNFAYFPFSSLVQSLHSTSHHQK